MPRLFGTDGVRGVANEALTPDLALALGRAAGLVLAPDGGEFVVGRDTRVSGPMLEGALVAGLCSAGVDVRTAGVVPTPAVAFLTLAEGARAGAVISASHNPVADNGIKFFSSEGIKISAEADDMIEAVMQAADRPLPTGPDIGGARPFEHGTERYLEHLAGSLDGSLDGARVVLDCAYGAAWEVAPEAFRRAGADVVEMHAEPDGTRINVECGSTAPDEVARRVVAVGAHLGLAFDGDADRVLAIDERGRLVDGDRILALLAFRLQERDLLKNSIVVATVMSNLGFVRALTERGIEVVQAPVGDKYVAEAMRELGAVLGGEQSGHVIFGSHSTTGDGVLTGLQLASIVAGSDGELSVLGNLFESYPQVLINVRVASKHELESHQSLWEEVRLVERALGEDGRVLLRASGTEPLVRVMVEAAEEATARRRAEELAAAVERHLGPS
ncbi:MAG: phosphoglucosamine mutase [Actinomycetota bacterium]